jgi:hypothetical protein
MLCSKCVAVLSVRPLVGGVVVWLTGIAHLSCLNLRQWITIGVDIYSFILYGQAVTDYGMMCLWVCRGCRQPLAAASDVRFYGLLADAD